MKKNILIAILLLISLYFIQWDKEVIKGIISGIFIGLFIGRRLLK